MSIIRKGESARFLRLAHQLQDSPSRYQRDVTKKMINTSANIKEDDEEGQWLEGNDEHFE